MLNEIITATEFRPCSEGECRNQTNKLLWHGLSRDTGDKSIRYLEHFRPLCELHLKEQIELSKCVMLKEP